MITTILLVGIALLFAYIGSRRQLSAAQLLLVVVFFSTGGVFVLFPGLANRAAAALDVGRGADLLLYFAVLGGILVAANFYFRFKQNERLLIAIVRQVALLAPLRKDSSAGSE